MSDIRHHPDRSRGLLRGRRKGKPLRPNRLRAYEAGMARHALDLLQPCANLADLFAVPTRALALEIGFGAGEHLLHQLGRQPATGFIGCEPFLNGMARLLDDAQDHPGRDRLRVHEGDAREVLQWLPAASLDRVYLLYPDPWPKARHEKRRFITGETLPVLAAKMKPGAELRVATDVEAYKDTVRATAADHPVFRPDPSREESDPWDDWTRTRYEAKAIREGRIPAYFSFFAHVLPDRHKLLAKGGE